MFTQFSAKIKTLQSDGEGEYICKPIQSFLAKQGISHNKSCPYTPEHNGFAERKHKHIVETAITLLQNANLPFKFWTFACQTTIYSINRMSSPILLSKSPFELLYSAILEIHHLRVFGCSCFPLLKPYNNNKLQPKSAKCIFLGYASTYKGYICYELNHGKIYISRHDIFNEIDFPYGSFSSKSRCPTQAGVPTPLPVVFPNLQNVLVTPPIVHPSTPLPNSLPPPPILPQSIDIQGSPLPVVPEYSSESLPVVLEIPPLNLHPMKTRSKSRIIKKRVLFVSTTSSTVVHLTTTEPATYKSALKVPVWFNAMQEELNALYSQKT